MLYQLSYASAAQTQRTYQKGNTIARTIAFAASRRPGHTSPQSGSPYCTPCNPDCANSKAQTLSVDNCENVHKSLRGPRASPIWRLSLSLRVPDPVFRERAPRGLLGCGSGTDAKKSETIARRHGEAA